MPARLTQDSIKLIIASAVAVIGTVGATWKYIQSPSEPPKPKPYKRPW